MSGRLEGKTAIVTGSSSGIGEGIAVRFAEEGANVVTNSRKQERADRVAGDIREAGGEAIGVEADMTTYADVEELVDTAVRKFGSLDIMVNNAGVQANHPLLELGEDEWRTVIEVDLTGVFFGCKAAGQRMVDRDDGGQIINISSLFGHFGVQGRGNYNAAKAGVNNLTRSFAVELGEHEIGVNALAPGFIKTPLDEQTRGDDDSVYDETTWPYYGYTDDHIHNRVPLGRFGTIEEMANCTTFLAAGGHYISGQVITADGGWLAFGWGSKGR
ncbi:SDR family NAD(P)-dependent oxidoreductase [Haloplanus pelagicus]|jgi:3-oxoacyl-[acyl-carrier protein] reductase|uniref:SDR family NAD(P)-dependent oxidoreductase n=1 Tax=Haloplanus pelagicus TaxID=2949995 RepID=UPI00204024A7|nr:SDR family oxidoreductase [Haloplanus sp. HW8-1]